MDTFSQLDCMVESGALSEAQAESLKPIMAGLTGLQGNDLLLFIAATQLRTLGAISDFQFIPIYKSEDYDALVGEVIMADTSAGPFTITLPATPSLGDRIDIYDAQSTFATNNLTVDRNGNLIDGNPGDLVANLDNAHMQFVFNGGAQGWSAYNL